MLFTGRIIQQICFGLYDLQLRFDTKGLIIQTGNELEYTRADGSMYKWDGSMVGRTFRLIQFLKWRWKMLKWIIMTRCTYTFQMVSVYR